MIEPGTKYVIVGVHENSAWFGDRKNLYGALVETITLGRWQKTEHGPIGYWHGRVRLLEDKGCFKKNERFSFFAVYLRRVKEGA